MTSLPPAAPGSGEGTPEAAAQPKGVMVFANMAIPGYVSPAFPHTQTALLSLSLSLSLTHTHTHTQSPSFYWEVELVHIGESSSDTAQVAMGYLPSVDKPADGKPWTYPLEAVFIRR